MRATELPVGTVTFLFTDIEGSTALAQRLGPAWEAVVRQHDDMIRSAVGSHGGAIVRTTGDGFFAAFPDASAAAAAACDAQRALASHPWPNGAAVRARMGLHTGEGRLGGEDYVGLDVHRAARIADAGHGGQTLLSRVTHAMVERALPPGVRGRPLGAHRLKDLDHDEELYDLVVDGLASDFPPLRAAAGGAGNLPPERTSFVGREHDVRRLRELLDEAGLVTLTGPGGTGKTRLALRVARDIAERFPGGAWFADLSPIRDPNVVASAVAHLLGVETLPQARIDETIARRLAERPALVILDNFEQVVEAGSLVETMVRGAPEARVLVTSRVPLRLYGEQEYQVAPLPLPEDDDLEALARNEAVRLFVERARAVDQGFELNDENASSVRDLCVRLDGLPLAIELAASRTKLLSPRAICDRLIEHGNDLSARARDLPERQRTLRATIGWSYELLEEPHRRLLESLAVFSGGWTIEAVESVCDPGMYGLMPLDGLELLLEHSLIRRRGDRFEMLETIREYGLERLGERGEADVVGARHASHFAELVQAAEPHLTGPHRERWMDRLEEEQGNIRAALRWSVAADRAEIGLLMIAGLWRFWQSVGRGPEGASWATEVVSLPSAALRSRERCRGLLARGNLAYWLGDLELLRSAYEEALSIARELGAKDLEAEALFDLGYASIITEDVEEAVRRFDQAARIRSASGDRMGWAWTQIGKAMAYGLRRDHAAEVPLLETALTVFRETNDLFGLENALGMLAEVEFREGQLESAEERIRGLMTASPTHTSAIAGLSAMANIALARGDAERAVRLWGAADAMVAAAGGGRIPSMLVPLGDTREEAASALDPEVAASLHAEGLRMSPQEAVAYALGDG